MKTGCRSDSPRRCPRRCHDKFNEFERNKIFQNFWAMGDTDLQRNFIIQTSQTVSPERSTTNGQSRRNSTTRQFFYFDGLLVQVCQKFYIDTLGISQQWIRTVLAKRSANGILDADQRGKHPHPNVGTFMEERFLMENFLAQLPVLPSHYSRHDSRRLYLPPEFTI